MIAAPVLALTLVLASVAPEGDRTHSLPEAKVLRAIAVARNVEVFRLGDMSDPRERAAAGDARMGQHAILAKTAVEGETRARLKRVFANQATYESDTLCWLCRTCEGRTRLGIRFGKGQDKVDVVAYVPERILVVTSYRGMWSSHLDDELLAEFVSLKSLGAEWAQAIDAETSAPSARLGEGARDGTTFALVVELPEVREKTLPDYPSIAVEAGESGTVLVKALIDEQGRVADTRIAESVYMLDDAAVSAVREWKFAPARCGGRPVRVWVAVPVTFTIPPPQHARQGR